MEAGERLEDAVCREVLEETGLNVKPVAMFTIFERILRDPRGRPEYHYVLVDYICKPAGGRLRAGDDVSRAVWVRRAALGKYLLTEGTLDVIQQAYARRNGS